LKGIGIRGGFAAAMLVALLALAGCGEPPALNGIVKDNFGQPLADVTVSIPGTENSITTDATGAYKLPYSPGQLEVSFVKDGYQSETVPVGATVRTQFPMREVTLYKTIAQNGLYLVGKTRYYGPLNGCAINILMVRENVEFGFDRITAGGIDPSLVNLADLSLPVTMVEYFNPPPDPTTEPLKILYERYDRPEIARITYRTPEEITSREMELTPLETGARFGRWLATDIGLGTYAYAVADPTDRLPRPGASCTLFQLR
jgi:hypothetical protein